MADSFFISDLHISHRNILEFTTASGERQRNFASIDEMDSYIIDRCNSVVSPDDNLYILGDVVMNRSAIHKLSAINGKKHLILGNHDVHPIMEYLSVFSTVVAYRQFDGCSLSHVPLHPDSCKRWKANIHGHLHDKVVLLPDGTKDPRYVNVSCEQPHINYTPISWGCLKKEFGIA